MSVGRCITSRRTVFLSLLICLVFLTFPAQMADGFLKTRLDVLFNKQIHKRHRVVAFCVILVSVIIFSIKSRFEDQWVEILARIGSGKLTKQNYCKNDKVLHTSYYDFPSLENRYFAV